MLACYQLKRWFPKYLSGELLQNKSKLLKFNSHINTCNSCKLELREMQNTIGLVQQYKNKIVYPTEPDWNHFTVKLNARLAELRPTSPTPVFQTDYRVKLVKWLRTILVPQPAWVPSLAAIATVVLLTFQCIVFSHSFVPYKSGNILEKQQIATQPASSCHQNNIEKRIAITKYVFEQTNS